MKILLVYLLLEVVGMVGCSLYDPHLFPAAGPFFEGWYIRAVDHDSNRSFAVLFGKMLPATHTVAKFPAFLGLLYDDETMTRLFSYDDLPPPSVISITVNGGEPVTENPKLEGSAYFRWEAGEAGYVEVLPNEAIINVTVEGVHLEAQIGAPEPWDAGGEGPQGWLQYLPFSPLNWFIYSTHSPLLSYSLHFPNTHHHVSGHNGRVHMEKNWGKSFPRAWVWTQGMRLDNVTFAAAFGPVDFGPLTLSGHLGGYRNPHSQISIDFRPDNSYMVATHDSCQGDLLLNIYTLQHKIILHVFSPEKSFSHCLYGPTKHGFVKASQESYKATAEVIVFERNYLSFKEIDSQVIQLSALEFGGAYACDKKCNEIR